MATVLANFRGVLTQLDPHSSHPSHLRTIHLQHGYSSSPDRCQPSNFSGLGIPSKVITPALLLGMKERGNGLGLWVCRRLAIGFIAIACRAGQAEILKNGSASRRERHDMLKLKGSDGQRLCGAAISAAVGKAIANLPSTDARNIKHSRG